MPDIKTKESLKDIKRLDRSVNLAERMKDSLVQTKQVVPKAKEAEYEDPVIEAEEQTEAMAYKTAQLPYETARRVYRRAAAREQAEKREQNRRYTESKGNYESYDAELYAEPHEEGAAASVPREEKHLSHAGRSESAEGRDISMTSSRAPKTAERIQEVRPTERKRYQKSMKESAVTEARAVDTKTPRAAKHSEQGLEKAKTAGTSAVKYIMEKAENLLSSLAAGSSAAIVMVVIVCLVGLLVGSGFGILFAGEVEGGMSLQEAVQELNREYEAEVSAIKSSVSYTDLHTSGSRASWADVLAVYAVKITTDGDGQEAVTMTEEKLALLRGVFWDMNELSSHTETATDRIVTEQEDEEGNITEVVTYVQHIHLYIHTGSQTAEAMSLAYGFDAEQKSMLTELRAQMDSLEFLFGAADITDPQALELWNRLPAGLTEERREVIHQALTLVGKVSYFWGGKSLVLGWDDRWGQSMLVSSPGSYTTGTYRSYGLDCSGYVDWVFYNVSGGSYVIGRGGGCGAQHRNCVHIAWSEAQPGDLVFYPGDSHIGIVGGWDDHGNIQIIHCASGSLNGVVITGISGFTSVGRPYYYS